MIWLYIITGIKFVGIVFFLTVLVIRERRIKQAEDWCEFVKALRNMQVAFQQSGVHFSIIQEGLRKMTVITQGRNVRWYQANDKIRGATPAFTIIDEPFKEDSVDRGS